VKISSQYRERRNGRTILRVLEVKKEIRAYDGCPLALVLGRFDSVVWFADWRSHVEPCLPRRMTTGAESLGDWVKMSF
jgi:hypothetical protein